MLQHESTLDDISIESWGPWPFSDDFYKSEFWVAWSTMMGPRPNHNVIEMRRYLLRFLHVVPDVAHMTTIWRMRMNQNNSVARPICEWLKAQGVQFDTNAVVEDVSIDPVPGGFAATKIQVKLPTGHEEIAVAHNEKKNRDVVLMTLGSQVADMTVGAWDRAPRMKPHPGESPTLWERIAGRHPEFGSPGKFFSAPWRDRIGRARRSRGAHWRPAVGDVYDHRLWPDLARLSVEDHESGCNSGGSHNPGRLAMADHDRAVPEASLPGPVRQRVGRMGIQRCPERPVGGRPMWDYTGKEILTETVRQLGFDQYLPEIEAECECIPCCLPYASSVWMVRNHLNRPEVVPSGAKNFAFIGQFCEMPKDTMFTLEYSVRSARETVCRLPDLPMKTTNPINPIPVYQAWRDPQALFAAAKAFVF